MVESLFFFVWEMKTIHLFFFCCKKSTMSIPKTVSPLLSLSIEH